MKKIIFDLDDTLYIDNGLRKEREKIILDFLGDKKCDYLKLKLKNNTLNSLINLGFQKKDFFKLMNRVSINLNKNERLIKILGVLRQSYRLIVLSNSSRDCVEKSLEKLGILNLIDEFYTGEDFEHPKPDRRCFFMVKKGDIAVGNNFKKDLEIPKKLGAKTILIGGKDFRADIIIKEIYELGKILSKN